MACFLYANRRDDEVAEYRGAATKKVAMAVAETAPKWARPDDYRLWCNTRMLQSQLADLELFGVKMDRVQYESDLHSGFNALMRFLSITGKIHVLDDAGKPLCPWCARELAISGGCDVCMQFADKYDFKGIGRYDPSLHPDSQVFPP